MAEVPKAFQRRGRGKAKQADQDEEVAQIDQRQREEGPVVLEVGLVTRDHP